MELRNYTNIPQGTKVFGASGKYSHKDNTYNGKYHPNLDNIAPSFNAIEIDWNGYNTGTKTINNTVDFLDWIEEETENARPSFNNHYSPSAYNGTIIKNLPISVDGRSTNIPVDNYGHFLIDGLPREFGYLYIGDGECSDNSNHIIHNHVNRNNFKQLSDVYYYPAYINEAIEYTVDKNHEYGEDDSSTIYIVIKEGFDFIIKLGMFTINNDQLEKFDTHDGYNFFKLDDFEDNVTIQLVLQPN